MLSPGIKVSEDAGITWHDMPAWVEFFIRQGVQWPDYTAIAGGRRIRLISMPCQSHGAGLIALGAVARDLSDKSANDKIRHYAGLVKYARQYLAFCKSCGLTKCNPVFKRCGFKQEATGRVFKVKTKTKYMISPDSDLVAENIKFTLRQSTVTITNPEDYFEYYPEGGIPLGDGLKGARLDADSFESICGASSGLVENLSTAYSGLCYAGPPAFHGTGTKRYNHSFRFACGETMSLAEILPIYGWGSPKVPRLVFVDTNGDVSFSHAPISPRLLIADGTDAFLKCLDHPDLICANVIAVVRRDEHRDKNEALAGKLRSLLQWYARQSPAIIAPPGVGVVDFIPMA